MNEDYMNYRYIKSNRKDGVYLEIWNNDEKIKEEKQQPQRKWNPPSDHKETMKDDLGLFQMLNNFDKVQEKIENGQKEVYQDGWSIAPIDHKISDNIPNKSKENQLGFKWISLREIPDGEEDE